MSGGVYTVHVPVVGLNYCTTCYRIAPQRFVDEGFRNRCEVALCPGWRRKIRVKNLVDPAMAAYAVGGYDAIYTVFRNHPRVRVECFVAETQGRQIRKERYYFSLVHIDRD